MELNVTYDGSVCRARSVTEEGTVCGATIGVTDVGPMCEAQSNR